MINTRTKWIEYQEPKLNNTLGACLGTEGAIKVDGRLKKFSRIHALALKNAPIRGATHYYIMKSPTWQYSEAHIISPLISLGSI